MPDPSTRYDAIVVGGGPAGLNAALYLGRSLRRTLLVDSGDARNMAARVMHNHLTNDGVEIADFRRRARAEIARYDVDLLDDEVLRAEPTDDGVRITTRDGGTFDGRVLLYAAGVRSLLPDVPGVEELWGERVFECPYCHAYEVRGERLAVYGGDEPSECLAATLTQWSPSVTYLPGERELPEEEAGHVALAQLPMITGAIAKVVPHGEGIAVSFESGRTEEYRAMFMHTKVAPRLEPLRGWVDADDLWSLQTDERGRTSVPKLYVAGDLGMNMQQVVMAASSGALAAMGINSDLIREDRPGSLYTPEPAEA